MAKLWSYKAQSATIENPVTRENYLENIKGQLWHWNKETKQNDFTVLNNFIILAVWFTVKGKVWNDSIKSYTNTYYSNEIRDFSETVYAIDMTFNPTTKKLVAKWNWKTDVKPHMPQWVWITSMITVLDLNDWIVKAFTVSASQYFWPTWLWAIINWFNPEDRLSYTITKMYTNGTKDKDGNENMITESQLDDMKGSEASWYKNRYISNISLVWPATEEQINSAETIMDSIDEYYNSSKAYYNKTYWEGEVKKEWTYAKLDDKIESDEDFANKVKEEAKIAKVNNMDTTEEISVEDIPF